MDLYDPQTLGIMVFGGFMVISALGIALVSTFSMKETSYEEAMAKQRMELGKNAPLGQLTKKDKKKDKVAEKKNRGKKKDDKPNGKLPETEVSMDEPEPKVEPEPTPELVAVIEPTAVPAAKAAPKAASKAGPKPIRGPVSAPEPTPVPVPKTALKAASKPNPGPAIENNPVSFSKSAAKPAQAPVSNPKPAQTPVSNPKPAQAPVSNPKPAQTPVSNPKPAQASVSNPKPAQAPVSNPKPAQASVSTPTVAEVPSAAPPKKKKEKKVAKVEPAQAAVHQAAPAAPSKPAPVLEVISKDLPVMAVPPVGPRQTAAKPQDSRAQEPPKKKSAGKKAEPAAAVDSGVEPLYLPFKALVSTLSSTVFTEGEAQRLIEILSDKAGFRQDTWQMATQKGDPVAVMKKQFEENQKQLAAHKEDATAAKNRLRELTKELSAEKSRVTSVETRLSSQLSSREQEMIALQARMQASYQDHLAQTQTLNTKIVSLQEQLESGPTAQLTRLQQENSILRDALNQASSQAESKQNAELDKLKQDCARLTKELGEKTEQMQAEEKVHASLEAKASAAEKQLSLLQASHAESKQALQRRVEEVSEELRTCQSTLGKAQQDATALSELQVRLDSLERDLKERSAQVKDLTSKVEQSELEKGQLEDKVRSINVLLEARQNKEDHFTELEQLKSSLQDRNNQLITLQEELNQIKETNQEAARTAQEFSASVTEQAPNSEQGHLVASLQEELTHLREELLEVKNSSLATAVILEQKDQLVNSLKARDSQVASLEEELKQLRETSQQQSNVTTELAALQTSLAARETMITSLEEELKQVRDQSKQFEENLADVQQRQDSQPSTELPDLLEKLKETEESHRTLQTECNQYRVVLAETEGMLKDLQRSVEEEELVWKSKMAVSQDQLKKALEQVHMLEETTVSLKAGNQSIEQLKEQVITLEAQLEKQSESVLTEREHIAQLKNLLSDCQRQLVSAQGEAETHREEMAMVRGQLSKATERAQRQEAVPEAWSHNSQLDSEAQTTVLDLQLQLDLVRAAGDAPQVDTEDVGLLKEQLQKERKLSNDLGHAATKLQQLLKITQEQLAKEKTKLCTVQDSDEAKEESTEQKEGTSV
ncbi:hypothetical protein UPYG_G00329510 [Umbra pygmaea]|uniref:Ribosome receptor lysine/proline rich domain-containing protein n=1 Tax=Umbra pygmaea TaxID=75934 RepID=A0ABD0W2S0_UMBPY